MTCLRRPYTKEVRKQPWWIRLTRSECPVDTWLGSGRRVTFVRLTRHLCPVDTWHGSCWTWRASCWHVTWVRLTRDMGPIDRDMGPVDTWHGSGRRVICVRLTRGMGPVDTWRGKRCLATVSLFLSTCKHVHSWTFVAGCEIYHTLPYSFTSIKAIYNGNKGIRWGLIKVGQQWTCFYHELMKLSVRFRLLGQTWQQLVKIWWDQIITSTRTTSLHVKIVFCGLTVYQSTNGCIFG